VPLIQPAGDFAAEYTALTERAGVSDWCDRTLIEIAGTDRAVFLHNFCTNEIKGLTPGSGCELFVTDVKGRTVGHGVVYCQEQSLVLETVADQGEKLISHLDRYVIREDVQLHDRSDEWSQFVLVGPEADALVQSRWDVTVPVQCCSHVAVEQAAAELRICRTDWFGPVGFLLRGTRETLGSVLGDLMDGAVGCGPRAIEAIRVEAGTPWYGQDISDANLPQEVARNQQAISFTKGCYLGQETVARLDAMGHVNRLLCGVRFEGQDVPTPGVELKMDGRSVGQTTSAVFSPHLNAPLALAYIRAGCNHVGSRMDSDFGSAEVVAMPVRTG
jgi:folate-binding protein YgfZ